MHAERRLWSAVLLQAFEDLEQEPIDSYDYNGAVAFFFGSGDWVQSRRTICDFLGLDPADIRRPALRILNQRRLTAGLPPLQPRPVCARPRPPEQRVSEPAAAVASPKPPLPRLVATPDPAKAPRKRGQHGGHRHGVYNPFNPFVPLPSERRAADRSAT